MAEEREDAPSRWLVGLTRVGLFLVGLPRAAKIVLASGWMVLIWALSSSSFDRPPGGPSVLWSALANLAHAPLFGLLALFVLAAVLPRCEGVLPVVSRSHVLVALVAAGGYGALDEWHQSWTPGRDSTGLDVLIDLTGAACVLWVVAGVARHDARPDRARDVRKRLAVGMIACVLAAGVASVAS